MGRAGRVQIGSAVTDPIIVCPARQAAEYRAAHPGIKVHPCPDDVKGIASTRQWIYEDFGDVFMLDDDIEYLYLTHLLQGLWRRRLTPAKARDAVEGIWRFAEELGVYLFTLGHTDERIFQPCRPFDLTGVALGYQIGLRAGSKIFFDPRAPTADDLFASGINAYYHRMFLRDNRFSSRNFTSSKNSGGCATYRTDEVEKKSYLFLVESFGDNVSLKESVYLPKNSGIAGRQLTPWARSLHIPF